MGFMDLIDKARGLIGDGGIDALTDKAGELSEIAQGDGSVLEKAEQAIDGLGEGGEAPGDPPGKS